MRYFSILVIWFTLVSNSQANDEVIKYENALKTITSGQIKIEAINDTPVAGMKELTVNTGRSLEILYISENGQYIFNGNLFDIKNKKDITEEKKSQLRQQYLSQIDDRNRLNYFPENMQYKVTVFTDIDCPYCRQLHAQMDEYNDLGIGISYLFFPRSGLGTPSADKAITVWCSDNQKQAMNKSKSGEELTQLQCDNPISEHYNSGIAVGVTGTPAIILADGTLIPGLVPPAQLKQRLDALSNRNSD